ncbi:low molecular weight phosphotyrosine protein phosphatase [Streptomyces sp. NPDC059134]|uniref:arsenate reductase/protein-tyrosine-phosphatase family protein n=1 Tax=Streptomyces sp. NPDC059134 TaxID=3346738 RepID=UPI00367DA957
MRGGRARRILTVCLGNHCRSPLAAVVLDRLGGATIEARSAGIRDRWAGRPAHSTRVRVAALRGYDLSAHRGAQVSGDLLEWADVVLAMDGTILAALRDLSDERTGAKLGLYLEDRDVPDPWGRDDAAFVAVVTLIEDGAARFLP